MNDHDVIELPRRRMRQVCDEKSLASYVLFMMLYAIMAGGLVLLAFKLQSEASFRSDRILVPIWLLSISCAGLAVNEFFGFFKAFDKQEETWQKLNESDTTHYYGDSA